MYDKKEFVLLYHLEDKYILEKTEGAVKDGQSRDTNNVGQKTTDEDKQNKKPRHKNLKR